MTTPYDFDAFSYRVNFAARVIISGARTTRSFDTCFEMYDGAQVAAALWRRSLKNPRLSANLPRYINAEMARDDYEEHIGKNLAAEARRVRKKRQAESDAFFADLEAKRQAEQHV